MQWRKRVTAQSVAGLVKGEFLIQLSPLAPRRRPAETHGMLIAWTTVATRADAERIAAETIALGLAACVQIEGPIVSHYRWQDRAVRADEFRLCFKCLLAQLPTLEKHVLATHPYETPEWLVVRTERVAEKYLSWAEANSTTPPL